MKKVEVWEGQFNEIIERMKSRSGFSERAASRLLESGNTICNIPLESAEDLIAHGKRFASKIQEEKPNLYLKELLPEEFPQIAVSLAKPAFLTQTFGMSLPDQKGEIDKHLAKLKEEYNIEDVDIMLPDLPTCLTLVSHFGLQVTKHPSGRNHEDVFAMTTTPIKNSPYVCTVRLSNISDGLFISFCDPTKGSSNVVAIPILVPSAQAKI